MVLQVEVVSPERILYSGEADMVIARTVGGGDIAFLSGHAPFVGALEIATVSVHSSQGDDELVAVHGGFVEVSSNGSGEDGRPLTKVTVLSDVAELASQIDVDRARRAKERADERIRQTSELDVEAEAAARRASVRLAAAEAY